jgi:adenine-specific DNA-methyltransferase
VPKKPNYAEYSKDELIDKITELEQRKKYGLVWESEREPEKVVTQCKKQFPVLKEVKSKSIQNDPVKPTHILIEGDNYHALSVLNYTHQNAIDVIYIDPPFNTGNKSWKYNNAFVDSEDSFRHSKWITMMDKRLRLAKNLLNEKGVIVVAIDDYECHTLRLLMDEIFNENNRLGIITLVNKAEGRTDDKFIATAHEYMVVYAKNSEHAKINGLPLPEEKILEKYPLKDDISLYRYKPLRRGGSNSRRVDRPNLFYPVYFRKSDGEIALLKFNKSIEILPIDSFGVERVWQWGKSTFNERMKTEILIKESKNTPSGLDIHRKVRLNNTTKVKSFWYSPKYNAAAHGTKLLEDILGKNRAFEYPKSLYAVLDTLIATTSDNSIVLDFFAGSGTTAHAVLELNKIDDGKRQVILNTNNENDICKNVCYPRVKNVINGYKNKKGRKIEGFGENLKYFKTSFVPAKLTDSNKEKLTKQSVEMLCLKENTFESVLDLDNIKIFKNNDHYTGILFDEEEIQNFKEQIKDFDLPVSVYVFSLGDDNFAEEFSDIKDKVKVCSIPVAILRVYKRIFR